jgi:hypothetical protein
LEAPPGFEPGMEVLQTSALPLGDGALLGDGGRNQSYILLGTLAVSRSEDNSVRTGERNERR